MANNNNLYLNYESNKQLNFYSKKDALSQTNKNFKKKTSNLLLKFEKLEPKINLKKSFPTKIHDNNLTYSSKKNINKKKINLSSSLFKSSPKNILSSLENNILIGKFSNIKNELLPKIINNKKYIKLNIKSKNSMNINKSNDSNDKNNKSKFILLSTLQNFNSDKNKNVRTYYNLLYKELDSMKSSNEEMCKNDTFYTYIIRPENCGYLIKNCFKHRKNWKEIEDLKNKNYNFKWQETTRGINYKILSSTENKKQMVNHFEFLGVLSNKANLFINMMQYAERKEENVFKYLPFTVLFDYNKQNFFNKLISFEYIFKNLSDFIVSYSEMDERNYQKDKEKIYGLFFPFIDRIGNKTVINIPDSHFEYKKISLRDIIVNKKKIPKIKNNYWIIKAPDLNRGMCIKIVNNMILIKRSIREYSMGIRKGYNDKNNNDENFNDCDTFDSNIHSQNQYKNDEKQSTNNNEFYTKNSNYINSLYNSYKIRKNKFASPNKEINTNFNNYRSHICVIQKYIEKPLLYFGRKFDIRIWVLLTQKLSVYMFEEGHLKCCSVNYNLNSDNTFCHLTNYSFQKYNSNFGKYEFGNEVSFSDLQKNIDINYEKKFNFKNDILPKIKKIIKFTFESVKNKINPMERKYCFEIFGFDFMLDCNFQPFLIEVNSNPGLEESSPLIKMLVPRMLDDALRLTLDKEFETIYDFNGNEKNSSDVSFNYESPFHVEGYSDNENMFKFICDLKENYKNLDYMKFVKNSNFFFRNKHLDNL